MGNFFLLVEYGKKIADNKSLRVCRPSHSLGTYRWGRSSSRQMKLCKLDNKVHEIRRQSGRKISWHTKILEMKENVWFILFGLDIYRASNRTLSINCYKKLLQEARTIPFQKQSQYVDNPSSWNVLLWPCTKVIESAILSNLFRILRGVLKISRLKWSLICMVDSTGFAEVGNHLISLLAPENVLKMTRSRNNSECCLKLIIL